MHVAPACAGSNYFGSYVRNLSLYFCQRLFLVLEPMTSWSQGNNRNLSLHFCQRLFLVLEPMTSWSQGNSFTAVPGLPFM
jgi:hypothetical protein